MSTLQGVSSAKTDAVNLASKQNQNTNNTENNVFASGTGDVTPIKLDESAKQIKIERENKFATTINDYNNIDKNDALKFIKDVFNITEEQLYDINQVEEDKFNSINILLGDVFEFIVNTPENFWGKNQKSDNKVNLQSAAKEIKSMLDNGVEIEQASKFVKNFENNGLFDILKIRCPEELKDCKWASDVSKEVLVSCIEKFISYHKQHSGTNDSEDIGKSIQIFMNLLGRTSNEDKAALLEAYIKVAENNNDVNKALKSTFGSFQTKEELEKFLNSDAVSDLITTLNLPKDEISNALLGLFKAAQKHGVDKQAVIDTLKRYVEPILNKYREIHDKPKEQRTSEDNEFMDNWDKIGEKIAAVLEVLGAKDTQNITEYTSWANIIGIKEEEYYQAIYKISQDNNLELDINDLNTKTEGKFSQAISKQIIEDASQDKKVTTDLGLQQNKSLEDVQKSMDYIANNAFKNSKTNNNDCQFVIEKTDSSQPLIRTSETSVKNWLSEANHNMQDLIRQCTQEQNAVKAIVEDYIYSLNKSLFIFNLNLLTSIGLKTEFLLRNNKFADDPEVYKKVKLTHDADALVKNKIEERNKLKSGDNQTDLT